MKRLLMLLVLITLSVFFSAVVVLANPIAPWFLRDSPVGNPNAIWDDQWSGGTVYPPGEIITGMPPSEGHPCADDESAASIAPIGSGANALRAYSEVIFVDDQTWPRGDALFSFRQTCWEVATVEVTLYLVDPDGSNPVFLASDSQTITGGTWPPLQMFFELRNIPQMPMNAVRFLLVISSEDGQCTDLVWNCWAWDSWIYLPARSIPTEKAAWGAVKALYR